jgi:hypothetical protein
MGAAAFFLNDHRTGPHGVSRPHGETAGVKRLVESHIGTGAIEQEMSLRTIAAYTSY